MGAAVVLSALLVMTSSIVEVSAFTARKATQFQTVLGEPDKLSFHGNGKLVTSAAASIESQAVLASHPSFSRKQNGQVPLNMSRPISFLHISKTGGTNFYTGFLSVYAEKGVFPNEGDQTINIKEQGLLRSLGFRPHQLYLAMIRGSPRQHLWAMYGECRYDTWGRNVTAGTEFPRDVNPADGFKRWIHHFCQDMEGNDKSAGWRYGCYHPSNYQSRALTSHAELPHGIEDDPPAPSIMLAMEKLYSSLAYFGITEFFDASVCLYLGSITTGVRPGLPVKNASIYVQQKCRCDVDDGSVTNYTSHIPSSAAFPRSLNLEMVKGLGDKNQECMDKLTHVDTQMTRHVIHAFLRRIIGFEHKLGRRVLCNNVLAKQGPLMTDVIANISRLYFWLKKTTTQSK